MADIERLNEILSNKGQIGFPNNEQAIDRLKSDLENARSVSLKEAIYWYLNDSPSSKNTLVKQYPTGHLVFYGAEGRRILFTDPQGHPLHECEWGKDATGKPTLLQARFQLDCKQWIGIRPRSKTFTGQLDLKSQPDWESLTLDDLRQKASEVWNVPFSEIAYFYGDDSFVRKEDGLYEIRLTKDSLYALEKGNFERTLFISFMFAVNWADLDLIPVVELFQSTLPGSGGAVFELIWGLFEDQSRDGTKAPLRYRGLPTYPSKEAFNIFSAFFDPDPPEGQNVMDVFMDPNRSHQITWTPKANPPWRYFDDKRKICLTIQDHFLYKVTVIDDPTGLPFINDSRGGYGPCGRYIDVGDHSFELVDEETRLQIPLQAEWNVLPGKKRENRQTHSFTWRNFFPDGPPKTDPIKALYTVPFFPEGDAEVEEASIQPLALDQIFYYLEMSPHIQGKLDNIDRILVHTFDSVIAGCIDCTHDRIYKVLWSDPEFAQKNAQSLWGYAASRNQLDLVKRVEFLKEDDHVNEIYQQKFGMIFKWIPLFYHQDRDICEKILQATVDALEPDGLLCLVGPAPIVGLFDYFGLNPLHDDPIASMPFFQQHLKICPENFINPDLTVFLAEKKPA